MPPESRREPSAVHAEHSAIVPLYFWRGARPSLLDFSEDEAGWMICLRLQREGDCCLLPVAWQSGALVTAGPAPFPTVNTIAPDLEAVRLQLNDLRGDGWRVTGRLDWQMSGRQTNPDMEKEIRAFLWRQPGEKDGTEHGHPLFD